MSRPKRGRGNAGNAMLIAARKAEKLMRGARPKKDSVTSENYKEYLYGKHSPLLGPRQA